MSALRNFAKDCIVKKKEVFTSTTQLDKIKYFVIFENDDIDYSEQDSILDRTGIKYSFIFIKVNYVPFLSYCYNAYLSPIIITTDGLKASDGEIVFDSWTCRFRGQDLNVGASLLAYTIEDKQGNYLYSNNFSLELPSPFMSFEKAYNLVMTIGECYSRDSAQFVIDSFDRKNPIAKKGLIDELMKEVSQLRLDVIVKNQLIENYQKKFNALKEIIN